MIISYIVEARIVENFVISEGVAALSLSLFLFLTVLSTGLNCLELSLNYLGLA